MPFDIGGFIFNGDRIENDARAGIVTDGLVLHLDAGISESYPKSGTTWYDISGNDHEGTILSDVSNLTTPDRFNFITSTGSNSRVTIPHSTDFNYSYDNWAYSFWIKQLVDDNGGWAQLFVKGDGEGWRRPGVWFYNGETSKLHITWRSATESQETLDTSTNFMLPINTWHNIVIQSKGGTMMAFKNGVLDSSLAISERITNTEPLSIGNVQSYRTLNMEIANFMIYNKGLSDTEITQNFNAQRARFGL